MTLLLFNLVKDVWLFKLPNRAVKKYPSKTEQHRPACKNIFVIRERK